MGGHPDRAGTDRQLVWTAADIDGSATRRLPRSIRETVPSSELATHTAPAATATPAAARPTPIGRRASLRTRCGMGYRWSKKVRTWALKRAGCSMFEA
jgi:hypothetical protein